MDFDSIEVFITSVFMGLFAIINPIGNAPVFVGMVASFDKKSKIKIAKKANLISFIICVVFVLLGKTIFSLFGITLPAFQITGGILLFNAGLHLLQGKKAKIHSPNESIDRDAQSGGELAVSPLAIPILAGPGTIATVINFTGIYSTHLQTLGILACLVVIFSLTFFVFRYSDKVLDLLGSDIMNVISRIMGLIIMVMGTQLFIIGIKAAFLNS